MPGRDAHGRFASGYSADRGRGRQAAMPASMPSALRTAVMDVANIETTIKVNGRRKRVTYFEAQLWKLSLGKCSHRGSPAPFIRMVVESARQSELEDEAPAPTGVRAELLALHAQMLARIDAGSEDEADEAIAAYLYAARALGGKPPRG